MKKKIVVLFFIISVFIFILISFNSSIINKKDILGLWINEKNENIIEFNSDNTFIFYSIDMSGKYELSREGNLTLIDELKGQHTFKWDDELPEKYEEDTILMIEIIYNWYADENNIYLNGKKLHR